MTYLLLTLRCITRLAQAGVVVVVIATCVQVQQLTAADVTPSQACPCFRYVAAAMSGQRC